MIDKNNDFYKILQVHPDAAQEIIDAAYRCLSKKYHPDINKNHMATELMKDINIAYGVVGDSKKRRQYHYNWVKQNKTEKTVAPLYSNSNFQKRENRDKTGEVRNDETEAMGVLTEFFTETVNENWEEAYQKLTKLDNENVPLIDFVEWKEVVTQVYKLGDFKISFFRRYLNCDYAGTIYPIILQFSVKLNEMRVSNSQISENNTQKYVAFDGERWAVCLGYTDLKSNISKFRYLAQSLPKADKEDIYVKAIEKIDLQTGLFSLRGFLEQAEREALRSKRYGSPLALAVIEVEPVENKSIHEELATPEACISYFAEALVKIMRRTDLVGRCGESFFAIVFTETKVPDAKKALTKLLDACEPNEYLNFKVYSSCTGLINEDIEGTIKDCLEKVVLREKRAEKKNLLNEKAEESAKLGKYKISDILGFNKKGRNHF